MAESRFKPSHLASKLARPVTAVSILPAATVRRTTELLYSLHSACELPYLFSLSNADGNFIYSRNIPSCGTVMVDGNVVMVPSPVPTSQRLKNKNHSRQPTVKTTRGSINWQIHKLTMVCPYGGVSFSSKKQRNTENTGWAVQTACWRKPPTKGHML